MKWGLGKLIGSSLATTALALAITASPGVAQETRESCRCVDASGTAIESCTCFRTPRLDGRISGLVALSQRPRLGISIEGSDGGGDEAIGVRIFEVMEDGPADDAGLREGDVITSIDGQSLRESIGADREEDFDLDTSIALQRLLALSRDFEPGQTVEVVYEREGRSQTTMLQAEDLSDRWGRTFAVRAPGFDAEVMRDRLRGVTEGLRFEGPQGGDLRIFGQGAAPSVLARYEGGRDGLQLVALNPGLGAYFGTDTGVLVAEVGPRSGLGLQAGDVVVRIGDRTVESPERFRRILGSYGDEEDIPFQIRRDGQDTTVKGRKRY